MTSTRKRPPRRPAKGTPGTRTNPVSAARRAGDTSMSPRTKAVLAVVAVAVLAAFVVALVAGGGDDGDDTATTGDEATPVEEAPGDDRAAPGEAAAVQVEGAPLAPLPERGDDPAVGKPMPTISGTGLDGEPLTVGGADGPEMIVFLAHWCPHCQAEVPVIQEWVDDGNLPEGVELTAVATANDSRRPNYPAADWLDEEGWTAPTLLDDGEDVAAVAGGVSSFPFMVFVDEDGNVAGRAAGELGPDELSDHVEGLGASS